MVQKVLILPGIVRSILAEGHTEVVIGNDRLEVVRG